MQKQKNNPKIQKKSTNCPSNSSPEILSLDAETSPQKQCELQFKRQNFHQEKFPLQQCNQQLPPHCAFLENLIKDSSTSSLRSFLLKSHFHWYSVHESAMGFAAALAGKILKSPIAFICSSHDFAARFVEDLETWHPGGLLVPETPILPGNGLEPDFDSLAEWIRALQLICSSSPPPWIVLTSSQITNPIPIPDLQNCEELILRAGTQRPIILETLTRWNYQRSNQVYQRGQFAERGGILDVFSWQAEFPIRIEFLGDEIDSLRTFEPESQLSISRVEQAILIPRPKLNTGCLFLTLLNQYHKVWIAHSETLPAHFSDGFSCICSTTDFNVPSPLAFYPCHEAEFFAGDLVLNEGKRAAFFTHLRSWIEKSWTILVLCSTEGEQERLIELLKQENIEISRLIFSLGLQNTAFVSHHLKLVVLTSSSLFGKRQSRRSQRLASRHERLVAARSIDDLTSFEVGDYVVHIDHGIGRFLGTTRLDSNEPEVLEIEYANEARLYVPLEEAWRVTRYIGLGKKVPELSTLGSLKWENTKQRAQRAILAYATQILTLQAKRCALPGFAHHLDNDWQREFEAAFPFRLTPDQARAIAETKADMESQRPMDRLICGDVGFGKTEVAIRAAFKAVMSGKQVAFLVPTTVLAQQHFHTLSERVSQFPVRVELLTRSRSQKEQTSILRDLRSGKIDILVGTHRILSPDVHWHDLGLVIIDEEQRFGVLHKETLKQRFELVDVLTLSATPIPRTLYLALMGARDMSLIETPPANRHPIETIICHYDERIIRNAIQRELDRGGQVFFLHNRIATIERTAKRIQNLHPSARIAIAHGQMPNHKLEEIMLNFVDGKIDVLVSTTIIESGLDIPNANTILIDRADRFGLADLYQLRGRVGRSGTKAVAYLFLPRDFLPTSSAHKRVSAISQYTELGSGFKIAMRDLEIRGAGNLLGTVQSGHIVAIGFDLYCKLLRSAVERLSGTQPKSIPQASLSLDFVKFLEHDFLAEPDGYAGAFLPQNYICDSRIRIEAYRKFHEANSPAQIQKLEEEWRDRFGPLPIEAKNLLLTARIRFAAGERSVQSVTVREDKLILKKNEDFIQISGKFPRLSSSDPNERLYEILEKILSLKPKSGNSETLTQN
ncbi:MAG: transcription-repair coupling factor [Chthoniobacterales bacterium]|nr:transcription-repair coupling factor [Chthoniobacterales bacterium]